MKKLERYILTEFLKLLALTITGFIILFLLVDLFENMDNLVKFRVGLLSSAAFFLYKIPFIISQISPVSVLLSVLLSTGMLAKNNEITAIRASGVRLFRVFLPLFIAGLVISAGVIFINEYVTPAGLKRVESFKRTWFGERGSGFFGKEGLWVRTDSSIINIRDMDLNKGALYGLTAYRIEKPFTIKRRVSANLVTWKGDQWVAERARVWDFSGGGVTESRKRLLTIPGLSPPGEFSGAGDVNREMNISELRHFIRNLEADGYETYRYRTDLYNRIAFPFVNFIMVFLGIPFALKGVRTGGIAAGVGISVAVAFSYWIVFAMTRSLGAGGVVPPIIASAFPDVLFLTAGALLLSFVRE